MLDTNTLSRLAQIRNTRDLANFIADKDSSEKAQILEYVLADDDMCEQ